MLLGFGFFLLLLDMLVFLFAGKNKELGSLVVCNEENCGSRGEACLTPIHKCTVRTVVHDSPMQHSLHKYQIFIDIQWTKDSQ